MRLRFSPLAPGVSVPELTRYVRPFGFAVSALGLAAGAVLHFSGHPSWASLVWGGATVPVVLILLAEIVVSLRRGDFGLDIVAALSMISALLVGEELAAIIVALMYAGGQYLESFAEARARRDMTALLSRVPRSALRHRNGELEEVALDRVAPGDRLLVRQGDVVPADGTVADGVAVLDQSALTGESLPVQRQRGAAVMSGAGNVGAAFDLTVARRPAESTYAGIVRLVEAAQRSRAPMSRLADRFAIWFLVIVVAMAGGAWLVSGNVVRAVAVLVVATPCPLILAVPIAMVAGLSRAAGQGILVKGGKALERLTRIRTLVVDKTGTLTRGEARLVATIPLAETPALELLRLAASVEQASPHVIARALVEEARRQGLQLAVPADVSETPGEGVEGLVDGQRLTVGGLRFVEQRLGQAAAPPASYVTLPEAVVVAVGSEGRLLGLLVLADELRPQIEDVIAELRGLGVARIVLATGDRREVAESVVKSLNLDLLRTDLSPSEKTDVVLAERPNGPVMMVGDGVNDAPALAASDLGVAMGVRGAASSAEAADVVLLTDQLHGIPAAIRIARRSRAIALQSAYVGIGLSVLGMLAAAAGAITPVQGAMLQEVIDVCVILNALRALRRPPEEITSARRASKSPLESR
ncbi:MAG: cadmium-translocating P-type ATPase [Variibacter sp.]|nr:cadmium-translocating P-type ATPase [Variibacter sp.]